MAKSKKKGKSKRTSKGRMAVAPAKKRPEVIKKETIPIEVEREVEKQAKREAGTMKFLIVGAVVVVAIIAMFLFFSQRQGPSPDMVTQEQINKINQEIAKNMGGTTYPPELLEMLKICGSGFNRQFVQKTIVDDPFRMLIEGNGKFFGNFPRKINCNGKEYTYSLDIEDGWITTTYLGNVRVKSNITTGIVHRGVSIPSADMEAGVYIVVVKNEGRLDYRYELQEGSRLGELVSENTTGVNRDYNGTLLIP